MEEKLIVLRLQKLIDSISDIKDTLNDQKTGLSLEQIHNSKSAYIQYINQLQDTLGNGRSPIIRELARIQYNLFESINRLDMNDLIEMYSKDKLNSKAEIEEISELYLDYIFEAVEQELKISIIKCLCIYF